MTDNPFALTNIQRAVDEMQPQQGSNPFTMSSIQQEHQARQRAVLRTAIQANPDDAAEAQRLSRRFPAPMDVVLRNLQEFRQQGMVEDAAALLKNTPGLAAYLRDNPQAAQMAHDDLPALARVEQAIGKTTRYLLGADQGGGLQGDLAFGVNALKAGSAGIFRMVSEVAALPFDFLERVPAIGGNPLRRLAEGFGMIASEQLDAMQRAELPDAGNIRQGVRSGISSAVGNTAMLPLAFAGPGGIAAALTGMVAQQGGLTYAKDRDEGVPVGTAALHASADMLAEYVGERYFGAVGFLKRLTAGQNASKLMMWEITRDIPGEIGTTLWQNFNDWALTNPEKTLQDFIAEQPDAIVQTAVAALVGGTAQVAVGRGTVKVAEALLNRQVTTAEAQSDHQALVEAMQAAEASVLRERAPEQFREVLNQMARDGQVYVDAAVLNQLPPEVLQQMGNVQAELPAALAANAPVAVALADALTLLPGTPQADLFMQNARSAPDAPSLLEAEAAGKKAGEWLQNEAEKVIQQAADVEAMRASSEAVRTDLQAQLEATGRYRPAVNEAMSQWAAAFYTTMASRLGMTPQQFYEQYPLRILGQASQQGGQVIEQGVESPAFREWFGGSKVVDEAGAPRVMYHGTGADVTTFRAKQAGAIFLTPEPIFAQAYADTGAKWLQSRGQDGAARIMPVYVRAENPFDYENPEHRAKFIAAALAVGTKDGAGQDVVAREDGAPSLYSAGAIEAGLTTDADNWAMIEEPWAQAAIKAAGFDSFYVSEGGFKNLAVYDPNQIKSAVGNRGTYSRSSDSILEQGASDGFNRWVGEATRIDLEDAHEFIAGEPVVVAALHGTTGDFTAFDRSMANIEFDLGGGFYFSNNTRDVGANYAGLGPDLTNKIQQEAEKLESNEDLDPDEAKRVARAKWMAHEGLSMPVWVKFTNPVVLGGQRETQLTYEEAYDEETDDYGEPTGTLLDVVEALRGLAAAERFGDFDAEQVISDIMEKAVEDGGLSARQLIEVAGLSEGLVYAQDYDSEGKLASKEILRLAFEAAGFDGFIDTTVDEKFGSQSEGQRKFGEGMKGMDEGTVHFIAFRPEQIKSRIGNDGSFDANDPNILSQAALGTFNPQTLELVLGPNANLSTFFHETGHFFLEVLADIAGQDNAPQQIADDMNQVLRWFGVESLGAWNEMTLDQQRAYHERWAESIEQYIMEGRAPSAELAPLMRRFRAWLLSVYQSIKQFLAGRVTPEAGGPLEQRRSTQEVGRVFSAMSKEARDELIGVLFNWNGSRLNEDGDKIVTYPGRDGRYSYGKDGGKSNVSKAAFIDWLMSDGPFDPKVYGDSAIDPEWRAEIERLRSFVPSKTLAQGSPQQPGGIQLNDDIRRVMDRLLATDEQIAQAEAAAGMVPEDEATATAKERLQARSIRDLKWIVSARDKVIADIQKQAEVERRRVRMEVRAEVMSQPVYRAWQFLTGKGAPQDTAPPSSRAKASRDLDATKDSLLVAISKLGGLSRESAAKDLGVVADSFAVESGVFGAPVFRKDGGRSADDMREALTEAGYLRQFDEFGRTELRELEDLIAEELAGRPQYSMSFDYAAAGRREELPAWAAFGKLQTRVLRAWYGEADTAVWRRLAERRMTSDTTGVHPDVVADAFGFGDGRALVQALADARPPRDLIEELTAQRLLEEHGEMVDPAAIQQAANEAVHNEARAKALATELAAQSEMLDRREPTGQVDAAGRPRTVNVLLEAAKQFGAQVAARTQLRDLKAKAWAHTAAERRAAQRWQDATKAGKTEEAVQAKRDQVLNNAAAKALTDALAEAREIGTFFKRVTKGSGEAVVERGRDADIVDAARAVLQAYGVESRASRTATENLNALRTRDPDTFAAVEPIVAAATSSAQPLDALTVEELQGLHEQVQALWHLAKRSRQMEVDGNLMDIEDAAAELNARLVELGVPAEAPGQRQALTKADERRNWLQFATSVLRRVEQWAEGMDGKFGGPFLRYVFQPVKDAADRYRAERVEYRQRFRALVDAVAPLMPVAPIEAPELGYTFGKGHNGVGMAELLHAILHTGNESNKRKLLLGRGWGDKLEDGTVDTRRWDTFINRLISQGVLRREHFDFAQGVWDLLESTKAGAQRTHRDVFGYYFDEVTANPVTNALGTWRGGYVPAQADPAIVTDANLRALSELENESMAFSFPTTSKGFTKGRVEYNRPLKLDLRTLPQHIDKVLLFTHMEPAVRGAARLLRQPEVSQPLGRRDPSAYSGMLLPWLNRAARQQVETPIVGDGRVSRVASALRARAGAALMFANLSNTVQQITGLATAGVKVKPTLLLQATAQYLARPRQTAQAVADASSYMADRMSNEIAAMQDDLEQIVVNPSVYEQAQRWSLRHAFFLQRAFDNVLGPIVWTGAYNQAVAEGMSDTDAVRFADGAVRQTQGSTLPEDISRMETGNALVRMFTQFTGYFNMLANTSATGLQQIARDVGLRKGAGKALYVLTLGMLMPLWIAEAIAIAFRGGPEDEDKDGEYLDDWIAAVLGMGTLKGMLAAVPGLGQLANAGIARWNNNPADDRVSMSPAVSLLEGAVGAPHSIYKAIVDDANPQRAVRDVASFLSVVTGLPVATALARPAGYAAGMAADKIEPTSPADAARGLVTGTASPESKQR